MRKKGHDTSACFSPLPRDRETMKISQFLIGPEGTEENKMYANIFLPSPHAWEGVGKIGVQIDV